MQPQAGQRVGEYVLESELGRGAFGEVWKAKHHVWSDQSVAVKIPLDRAFLSRLQREGMATHQFDHPGIVRPLAFDPFAPIPYLAMELVDGQSLRPLIESRALPIEQATAILVQVLLALEHAHSKGVVHGDIKPENVLIDRNYQARDIETPGVVKLADFGMSPVSNAVATQSIALSMATSDPATRELAGTLEYMSPEQRRGEVIDARADLYACGVMLYELLTGEKPAGAEPPSELNKSVPAWLDEAFKRSYARLDKRFASASDFLNALRRPPALPKQVQTAYTEPTKLRLHGERACPACQRAINGIDQFCIHCGTQVTPSVRRCNACGGYPAPDDRFCNFCGSELSMPARMA